MFDRFTDRARMVMGYSRQQSQRYNHDYIGTEHILLGLIQEGTGTGSDVLRNLDVDLKQVRAAVGKIVVHGTTMVTMGQLPFTPRAKRVLELAYEEASNFGHNYIGTEHLLLGLIREEEGIGAQVLRASQVELDDVREEIFELLGGGGRKQAMLLLGIDDEGLPREIATRMQELLFEKGMRECAAETPTIVIAFAPERDPRIMYAVGVARGEGARVILLHLQGEKFELGDATCLEVNDDLPETLLAVLGLSP